MHLEKNKEEERERGEFTFHIHTKKTTNNLRSLTSSAVTIIKGD